MAKNVVPKDVFDDIKDRIRSVHKHQLTPTSALGGRRLQKAVCPRRQTAFVFLARLARICASGSLLNHKIVS